MSIDALNEAVASAGGSWVKLRTTDDTPIEGRIADFVKRDRTDPDGNVVFKKGTQTPRVEWVFTLEVDPADPDDDGVRKLPCNESMQRAISDAIKAAGKAAEVGGTLKVGVKEDPEDSFSQATYQAKYTPPAKTVDLDDEF
jgi:hypothetical protein